MDWKKFAKALLFPNWAVIVALIPLSIILLVGSMAFLGLQSILTYVSYLVASYTLMVLCLKIPNLIRIFKTFKNKNKFLKKWKEDARFRVKVSLYSSLAWNNLYGVFQIFLGFYYRTFWYSSFGVYYICLGVMRFSLFLHTKKYSQGENVKTELIKYRACGWVFLLINLALIPIIVFMVYMDRTFEHSMITTIAMAVYTFTSFIVAIVGAVKYKKYNSPVFSASKAISVAAGLVSVLILESTMLTTFSGGKMTLFEQKILLAITGGVISLLVVTMAIFMIITSTKKLKKIDTEVKNGK